MTFSDWFKHLFCLKMVIQFMAFLTLFWPFLDKNGQILKKNIISLARIDKFIFIVLTFLWEKALKWFLISDFYFFSNFGSAWKIQKISIISLKIAKNGHFWPFFSLVSIWKCCQKFCNKILRNMSTSNIHFLHI